MTDQLTRDARRLADYLVGRVFDSESPEDPTEGESLESVVTRLLSRSDGRALLDSIIHGWGRADDCDIDLCATYRDRATEAEADPAAFPDAIEHRDMCESCQLFARDLRLFLDAAPDVAPAGIGREKPASAAKAAISAACDRISVKWNRMGLVVLELVESAARATLTYLPEPAGLSLHGGGTRWFEIPFPNSTDVVEAALEVPVLEQAQPGTRKPRSVLEVGIRLRRGEATKSRAFRVRLLLDDEEELHDETCRIGPDEVIHISVGIDDERRNVTMELRLDDGPKSASARVRFELAPDLG